MPKRLVIPTAYEAAQGYLHGLSPVELATTSYHSNQLRDPLKSSTAFQRDEYHGIDFVPLLLTEEDGLGRTLDTIYRADTDAGVVVSANMPLGGKKLKTAARNMRELQDRVHGLPDFPIAFFFAAYDERTTIGRVSRDGYGAPIHHLAATRGPALVNMPIHRIDADMRRATTNYLPRVQTTAAQIEQPNYFIYPVVQHDRLDPVQFPNINRLLDWYDFHMDITKIPVSAHFAVDLIGYTAMGGLRPEVNISESMEILGAMDSNPTLPPVRIEHLADAAAWVSCRRLAKRSATEGVMEYDALYVPNDERPTHRTELPAQDISMGQYRRQAGYLLFATLHYIGDNVFRSLKEQGLSHNQAVAQASQVIAYEGNAAFERFGEPPEMQRMLDGVIRSWAHTGPPAGTKRRWVRHSFRRQNLISDPTAGGEGVLRYVH